MRRLAILLALPPFALAACGGTPTGDAAKRVDFLKNPVIKKLKDEELAHVCPSLYPSDFLGKKGAKKYHYTQETTKIVVTAQEKQLASAAGCTTQGTKPK